MMDFFNLAVPLWAVALFALPVAWYLYILQRRLDNRAKSIVHIDDWANVVDSRLENLETAKSHATYVKRLIESGGKQARQAHADAYRSRYPERR